ncbi:MAG: hypothetical protein AAF789_13210, partial [Bacteroidota bacterium]
LLVTERIENGDGFGVNAGSAINKGVELNLIGKILDNEEKWFKSLTFTGNTTFASYRFNRFIDDQNDFSGNRLPGLPSFIANSSFTSRFGANWRLQIDHHFYGNQYLDDENSSMLRNFSVWNLQLDYQQERGRVLVDIGFGINNLFDLKYSGMIVTNAPSFGGNAPRYFYPGQPRNYSISLQVSIQ